MRLAIVILSLAFLTSCGVAPPVKDPNPPSIDMGHKRIETVVCGNRAVGENGCVFPQGRVSGQLKIYRIYEGQITITGQGCGVDRSIDYKQEKGSEWIELDLADLVGDRLENDCVLSLYQFINFKGADNVPFPIRGMYGTVSLGTCPAGVSCSITVEQRRAGSALPMWAPQVPGPGSLIVQACGQNVVPESRYEKFSMDVRSIWPGGYPADGKTGCTLIAGVRADSGDRYKIYRRIWLYKKGTILLPTPAFDANSYQADSSVSLTIIDGEVVRKSSGSYKPKPEGNVFRFYTAQGRSLVVMVKGGKVVWTQ